MFPRCRSPPPIPAATSCASPPPCRRRFLLRLLLLCAGAGRRFSYLSRPPQHQQLQPEVGSGGRRTDKQGAASRCTTRCSPTYALTPPARRRSQRQRAPVSAPARGVMPDGGRERAGGWRWPVLVRRNMPSPCRISPWAIPQSGAHPHILFCKKVWSAGADEPGERRRTTSSDARKYEKGC